MRRTANCAVQCATYSECTRPTASWPESERMDEFNGRRLRILLAKLGMDTHTVGVTAGARAIRWLDDRDPRGAAVLREIFPHTGRAHIVGITGPPGAGKSTLTDMIVAELRRRGRKVGVIAIDPSSPFTGGAILGDRVR